MLNPYCPPDSPLSTPGQATGKWSLGKAFWLMFIPAAIMGNVLSVLALLALKAIAIEFSLPATPAFRTLAWLALAIPYLGTALLGFHAVRKSAPPKRLSWTRPVAFIVAATYVLGTAYIVTQAFFAAKLL